MEPQNSPIVDLNASNLPKPYRDLRSLINFFNLIIFGNIVVVIYVAWLFFSRPFSWLSLVNLVMYCTYLAFVYLSNAALKKFSKQAMRLFFIPVLAVLVYDLILLGFFKNLSVFYVSLAGLIVPALLLASMYSLVRKGVLV